MHVLNINVYRFFILCSSQFLLQYVIKFLCTSIPILLYESIAISMLQIVCNKFSVVGFIEEIFQKKIFFARITSEDCSFISNFLLPTVRTNKEKFNKTWKGNQKGIYTFLFKIQITEKVQSFC